MKVVKTINKLYYDQLDINQKLKKEVDNILRNNKKDSWHYLSRIKGPESFALKIETGRIENPSNLEDFFGCTLVVENSIEIQKALDLVEKFFKIEERRPRSNTYTHKRPESFQYDDLRLFVKLKERKDLPDDSERNILSKIKFELQIKTFLQHAWSIATHDLVYKGDEIDWAKQRISYQIKAMLEHAEISIHEIENIKKSDILPKLNKNIKKLNKIKEFLKELWPVELLSKDIIRLSENILNLIESLDIELEELKSMIIKETEEGKGTKILNLSPYFIILQIIISYKPEKIEKFFSKDLKSKILICDEIDFGKIEINNNKVIRLAPEK